MSQIICNNVQFWQHCSFSQELKDEALAIRLAADIASKKALDEIKSPTSSSSSSSRQRIREILQKQREDHEKRSEENKYAVEEKVPEPSKAEGKIC